MLLWIFAKAMSLIFAYLTYMILFDRTGVIDSWSKEDYFDVTICVVVGLLTAALAIGGLIYSYGI